jgi:glutaredoxin
MQTIRIYGRDDCIWCSRAKQFVEARNYTHRYVDVNEDVGARAYVARQLGTEDFTLPQIFVGETQLAVADKRGQLQQMIGGA